MLIGGLVVYKTSHHLNYSLTLTLSHPVLTLSLYFDFSLCLQQGQQVKKEEEEFGEV